MFSLKRISMAFLVAALWAPSSEAHSRNAVQTVAGDQCRLERSAHLQYHCDIPAGELKAGETILRSESIHRVFYPCEVRISAHANGFRVTVTKLSDPRYLGFNRSEADRCLREIKPGNESTIRYQILEAN